MSEVKIPCLSTPTRSRNCRPEKHREEDTAAESGEVAPLLGDSSVAMMEQQFSGYYSVYGGVSYPRQYCIIYGFTNCMHTVSGLHILCTMVRNFWVCMRA